MRLRYKKIPIKTGSPIALIEESIASRLDLHLGDRVNILHNGKKIGAALDFSKRLISANEIALSGEAASFLGIKEGDLLDLSLMVERESLAYIFKKLNGDKLSRKEIYSIIKDIVSNSLSEAEIAYFVSGVYQHGMSMDETISLTEAIYKTGKILTWQTDEIVDKHCIGGIPGNRTTPIVISICASAGIIMPKTSSRAITSAAGTADVIETLSRVDFSAERLQEIVKKTNACLAWGGSLGLAPADDKLIRVERLLDVDPEAQLLSSIMAKKLAVGSKYVLIDIPAGPGAKVSFAKAKKLKNKFMQIAKNFNIKLKVVFTDGRQPIGNGIGPVLEMIDVLKVLRRDNPPKDLEKKSILLSGIILEMTGKAKKGEGNNLAYELLNTGKAFEKFKEIINEQCGKIVDLKTAKYNKTIISKGFKKIKKINNHQINHLCRILGSPQDKTAGIYLFKHCKEYVKKGSPLIILFSESKEKLKEANRIYENSPPFQFY